MPIRPTKYVECAPSEAVMKSSQSAWLETNKNNIMGNNLIRIFYGGSLDASYDTGHASRTIYLYGRYLGRRA